jgi:hypothetical protein
MFGVAQEMTAMMMLPVGLELVTHFAQPTPMVPLALNVHLPRMTGLVRPEWFVTDPAMPATNDIGLFGDRCSGPVAPTNWFVLRRDAAVNDSGPPAVVAPRAMQTALEDQPASTLSCLLGSQGGATALRPDITWQPIALVPACWMHAQAICDGAPSSSLGPNQLDRFRVRTDVAEAA